MSEDERRKRARLVSGIPSAPDPSSANHAPTRIQAGHFGTQLSTILDSSLDTLDTLFGKVPSVGTPTFETLDVISKFLAQNELAHAAFNTSTTLGESHIAIASYYTPTLEEFAQTQLDRQAAGLSSNTNRASSDDLSKLVDSHRRGLCMALDAPNLSHLLSNDVLKTIHEHSLPPSSGENCELRGAFRTKVVRAGNTVFGPHEQITDEMNLVWKHILHLEKNIRQTYSSGVANVYYSIALAVMALYGICEVHPFADGNGRVARIYCNALLKCSMNLPFAITIAATPQQRQELVSGLRAADQSIGKVAPHNNAAAADDATIEGGILQPLIDMLIARLTHAILQLISLLEEKARASKDEEETKIARIVRERSAEGQCIICLENNPNIATLCCGQAVHLNCIAEWLANGTTCVSCRAPLPRLSVQRPPTEHDDQAPLRVEALLHDPQHEGPISWRRAIERVLALQNELDGVQGIMQRASEDDMETADTESIDETETAVVQDVLACRSCNNRAARDCDHSLCGRCCVDQGRSTSCGRHGTGHSEQSSTTTDEVQVLTDTTEDADDAQADTSSTGSGGNNGIQYCRFCNNRAAQDCHNELCGRCCVVRGLSYRCRRHGD
jgi:fido (protein-threonine AMPylation protein)